MRNKKMTAAAGLAAIMVIGGTWAYFNQSSVIKNPFSTGKYDSIVVEDFKPEDGDNWVPGATINKDVTVNNTGDYDLFVRVKLDETWTEKGTDTARKTNTGMDSTTSQANAADGLVTADGSVVKKIINQTNADKWFYNSTDGYWYYKYNLKAKGAEDGGDTTGIFLDAVQLIEEADMGLYTTTKYYTTAADAPDASDSANFSTDTSEAGTKWVVYTSENVPDGATHNIVITRQDSTKPGYGNADYTLTITVETVQATEAAMKSAFKLDAAPTDCTWTFTDASTSTDK